MPKRVLVVDDDPVQRRTLEEAIKRFGYAVAAVESGDKAIATLKADAPGDFSLVLLDLIALSLSCKYPPLFRSPTASSCHGRHGRRYVDSGEASRPTARGFHQNALKIVRLRRISA
jgi:DNA-binding NarL/FixJ family response regulator